MGEAKERGTYEERKAKAEERERMRFLEADRWWNQLDSIERVQIEKVFRDHKLPKVLWNHRRLWFDLFEVAAEMFVDVPEDPGEGNTP